MLQIRGTLAKPFLAVVAPILISCASADHKQICDLGVASPSVSPKSATTSDSTLPDTVVLEKSKDAKPSSSAQFGKLHSATAEELSKLKALDQKYQSSKSISMDLDKSLKLSVLNQERQSKGHLLISQGRLRMEIDKPDQSLVVVDKKNIWVVQFPPEDLKGATLQVIRASAETKKGRSQSFIGLLVKGGISKYFKVLNTSTSQDGSTTYFLQPQAGSTEFARAQLEVDSKGEQINELKYWDELSNETKFKFRNVSFNKKIAADKFQYTPPKNAEVTTY